MAGERTAGEKAVGKRTAREKTCACGECGRGPGAGRLAAGDTDSGRLEGLSPDERERYRRHVCLAGVGPAGQRRILAARVLVIGMGGLGSPIAMYLAAAGVGTLGLVDPDVVELSNLQRQIIHGSGDLGRPKVESALEAIRRVNPGIRVEAHRAALNADNAARLVEEYDIVVDGLDNLEDRLILSDACVAAGKPFVHGAVLGWTGQAMTYVPGHGPCYRCVFGTPPAAGGSDGSSETSETPNTCGLEGAAGVDRVGRDRLGPFDPVRVGVLSSVPGVIGAIEVTEALKLITGTGEPLAGRLLLFDALKMTFAEITVTPDPACPACG